MMGNKPKLKSAEKDLKKYVATATARNVSATKLLYADS